MKKRISKFICKILDSHVMKPYDLFNRAFICVRCSETITRFSTADHLQKINNEATPSCVDNKENVKKLDLNNLIKSLNDIKDK